MDWEKPFIQVGDRYIYAENEPDRTWKVSDLKCTRLATVLDLGREPATTQNLNKKINSFCTNDDVFCAEFLETIVFVLSSYSKHVEPAVLDALRSDWSTKAIIFIEANGQDVEGPFVLSSSGLHRVWRLYEDVNDCFLFAVVRSKKDHSTYTPFHCSINGGIHTTVAVPSRLYYRPTPDKPLSGIRVGIKDVYDLKGVRTSGGSRAFRDLYPPSETSAKILQKLIDFGVVVVGKTCCGQFASGSNPTESIDYFSNLNPRGEGYQSQAGSSTGSAGAIALYDWLDVALGTDTAGSLRGPAGAYGLYTMRPTQGIWPLDGILPQSRDMLDTPGALCRDLILFSNVIKTWQNSIRSSSFVTFPKRILYLTDWYPFDINYEEILIHTEFFIRDMESFLGVQREPFNLNKLFREQNPAGSGETFFDYLYHVLPDCMVYDMYHSYAKFREDYRLEYRREPYVDPGVEFEWAEARKVTPNRRTICGIKLGLVKDWLKKNLLPSEEDGGSNAIIIFPTARSFGPKYRDELPEQKDFDGFESRHDCLCVYGGFPELVLPIGEYKYHSRVSQKDELLPFTISIIGARGSDSMLMDLAEEFLQATGRVTAVKTGSRAFADQDVSEATIRGEEIEELDGSYCIVDND